MDFQEVLTKRYSTRSYLSKSVEDEKLNAVLEAARLAPTAANRQPFNLVVIHTEGRKEELRRIYNREWFTQAPLVICAVGLPEESWTRFDGQNYVTVDVAIAMDHLILTAASLGLGTCWIAAFDPNEAKAILELPDEVEPIIFTPLGYPNDKPKQKERKRLSELVRYENW